MKILPQILLPQHQPSSQLTEPLKRSTWIHKLATHLNDFICNNATTKQTTPYPIHSVIGYNKLLLSYKHFNLSISSLTEPTTYLQASKLDCWNQAMSAE